MSDQPRPPCPACASARVVPIAYGNPPYSMFEAEQRGELKLGGCIIDDENPRWFCRDCEHRFGKFEQEDKGDG